MLRPLLRPRPVRRAGSSGDSDFPILGALVILLLLVLAVGGGIVRPLDAAAREDRRKQLDALGGPPRP
jgi:hypothetical protein